MSTLQTNCYTMVLLAASCSRYIPPPSVYLQDNGDFYSSTRFQPWKHSGHHGGASPLVIKPVKPFLAPGTVSVLDELPKLGFLSLGILPVCDLLTGSTA